MALTATLFHLTLQLADMDREVYADLALHVAQQPSETAEFMLVRVLAYALGYEEGITARPRCRCTHLIASFWRRLRHACSGARS